MGSRATKPAGQWAPLALNWNLKWWTSCSKVCPRSGADVITDSLVDTANSSQDFAAAKKMMLTWHVMWQVGSRAERMGLQDSAHLYLYSATRLVEILQEIVAMQPRAVIIDSIQTVYLDDVNGSAGSVSQVSHMPSHFRC